MPKVSAQWTVAITLIFVIIGGITVTMTTITITITIITSTVIYVALMEAGP